MLIKCNDLTEKYSASRCMKYTYKSICRCTFFVLYTIVIHSMHVHVQTHMPMCIRVSMCCCGPQCVVYSLERNHPPSFVTAELQQTRPAHHLLTATKPHS